MYFLNGLPKCIEVLYGDALCSFKRDMIILMHRYLNTYIFLVLRIGGWLGMTCPHGICYGLKWLLRHEGPRDHVDMIMNLAAVPNVVVVDMANMVVVHARNRGYNVFHLTDVSQSVRQTISKRREMASWKLTGPGSPMAQRATQMTKLPLPTKSRPFVTLQLGLQNITVYLTNFMKKTLLIQLTVCGECRVSINLQERQIPRRPSSLTTGGTETTTSQHL